MDDGHLALPLSVLEAITVAAGLTQIGELSFVVVQVARSAGMVARERFQHGDRRVPDLDIAERLYRARRVRMGRSKGSVATGQVRVPQAGLTRRIAMRRIFILGLLFSVSMLGPRAQQRSGRSAGGVQPEDPQLLPFDELVTLSSTARPDGQLSARLDNLLTTPFVHNEAPPRASDRTAPRSRNLARFCALPRGTSNAA